MLRAAATVAVLLAALPAVTPLLGGYRVYGECRNLTTVRPGEWPDIPQQYKYTGLLLMPGDICSGVLITAISMLSNSMCRLWKDNVNFTNDVEEDGSEARIGPIQGLVSRQHYERLPISTYYHYGRTKAQVLKDPVMIVEFERPISEKFYSMFPGVLRSTPLSEGKQMYVIGDVVGFEHSVNMPIYHQSVFDARLYPYNEYCRKFGRTQWNLSQNAICTWDVSPVRTVCSIDRGAPVFVRKHIIGIVVGITDDMETPSNYCGEGRVHYNLFIQMKVFHAWIKNKTNGKAKIMNLVDGRAVEDCEDTEKGRVPPPRRPETTKRTHVQHKSVRAGAVQQRASVGPLLLAAVAIVARLANQC